MSAQSPSPQHPPAPLVERAHTSRVNTRTHNLPRLFVRNSRSMLAQLGHDAFFVTTGWVQTIVLGGALFTLTSAAVFSMPFFLFGVLLGPIVLLSAGAIGALSRLRYNTWAKNEALPRERAAWWPRTFRDYVATLKDVRAWGDLAFELILAPIVRVCSFIFVSSWMIAALLGIVLGVAVLGSGESLGMSESLASLVTEPPTEGSRAYWWVLADAGVLIAGAVFMGALAPLALHWSARAEARLTLECLTGDSLATIQWRGWATGAALVAANVMFFALVLSAVDGPVDSTPVLAIVAVLLVSSLPLAARAPRVAGGFFVVAQSVWLGVVLALESWRVTQGLEPSTDPLTLMTPALLLTGVGVIAFQSLNNRILTAAVTTIALAATSGIAFMLRWFIVGGFFPVSGFGMIATLAVWLMAIAAGAGLRSLMIAARHSMQERAARERAERLRDQAERERADAVTQRELFEQRSSELAERARIAREMHDVVAHSMSLISIQAQSAPFRLAASNLDSATREEFASIAATSRTALTEMRGLLTVLRRSAESPGGASTTRADGRESEPLTAPQPTLDDLPALVEHTRRAGAQIALAYSPTSIRPETLPGTVHLALYRAAQEGLANALRHAPGSIVTLSLARLPHAITLVVRNTAPVAPPLTNLGSGFGLRGVRERVETLGGSVSARQGEDGSYTLSVSIPAS